MKNTNLSFKPTSRKISDIELNTIVNEMLSLQEKFTDLKITKIRKSYLSLDKTDYLRIEFSYKGQEFTFSYTFLTGTNTKNLYLYQGVKHLLTQEKIKDYIAFVYIKFEIMDILKAI
jgi:hypothetical protein